MENKDQPLHMGSLTNVLLANVNVNCCCKLAKLVSYVANHRVTASISY